MTTDDDYIVISELAVHTVLTPVVHNIAKHDKELSNVVTSIRNEDHQGQQAADTRSAAGEVTQSAKNARQYTKNSTRRKRRRRLYFKPMPTIPEEAEVCPVVDRSKPECLAHNVSQSRAIGDRPQLRSSNIVWNDIHQYNATLFEVGLAIYGL